MSPLRAHLFQLSLTKHAVDLAADVARELDPAGRAPAYQSELAELKSAVKERRILDIPGELADAALAGQLGVSKATGTNLPLIGAGTAVKKRRAQQDVWRRAFAQRRIPFSEHYLSAGGDFGSPEQVRAAFLAAGKPIDEQDALQLSVQMTAMRDAGGPSLIDRDWSKAAAAPELSKFYEILSRAKRVRGSMGADAADRITMEHLGSVFGVANKRFYNQAGQLGITNRTPAAKVREMLSSVAATPAPVQGPLGQALMPFMGKQAGFEGDLDRVLQREGQIGVTTDRAGDSRGGATQAGISQSYFGKNPDGSWKKSKAQIAALTPAEIKSIYADIYKVPNKFKDPGVREVLFDMTTNAGPGANGILQRSVNRMLPPDRRIKVDNIAGSGTIATAQSLDQRELARHMLDGYSAHHQQLVKNRPDLYATNKNGWANRVSALRSRVLAPGAAPAAPQPAPVFINNRRPPQAAGPPTAPATTTRPGGPIPSMPLLSAPPQTVMGKQAGHALVNHFRRAGLVKAAEFRPRLCWSCGQGTDQDDTAESHYGRCDCKEKRASLAAHLRRARNKTHTHPTPAQAHAGNYAKGSLTMHGMAIKLENPKGTERRGYDKDGNIEWQRTMQADYGYFHGTQAIDGDAVDCFIGPDIDSHFVAVVEQNNSSGAFDELKVMLGYTNLDAARKGYLAHYPRGWESHIRSIIPTTAQALKGWLRSGRTKGTYPAPKTREKAAAGPTSEYFKVENDAFDRAVEQMPEGSDKEMAKKGHGQANGSCGCRIRGCRCPSTSHNISLTLDVPCEDCATEKAAKDYGKLLRNMRVRKGECPECGTPDQPPYPPCSCGQEKAAGIARSLAPYKTAFKEVMLGSKLPPMEQALKEVPRDADDLSLVLPRLKDLLKLTFSSAQKSAAYHASIA